MGALAARFAGPVLDLIWFRADVFALMLLRVGALVISSPVFGRTNIPMRYRVGFILVLAYFFMRVYPDGIQLHVANLWAFAGLCLTEILLGLILGWVTTMFFALVYTSGQIIDMQTGFGMVNLFDPQTNIQVPVFGALLNLITLLVFFMLNGHHRLIQIINLTIVNIPIGSVALSPQLGLIAAAAFSESFMLAISVAMPILATMFITEVALGIIIRTVPQMNMFVIGFPLKIFLGFVMMLVIMPVYVEFCNTIFNSMFGYIDKLFMGLMSVQ